jgi:hypothetical protein
MKKKVYWIAAGAIAVAFLLYHSVYFERLTEKRARETTSSVAGLQEQISGLWINELPALLAQALPLADFSTLLAADPSALIEQHGKSSGIGPFYSFVIQAEATLISVSDEELRFAIDHRLTAAVPIRYLFSNAVRDASGWFNLDDYDNTMDYNTVSSEINNHILAHVVTDAVRTLRAGDRILLHGVTEINRKELPDSQLEIIPLSIKRHE